MDKKSDSLPAVLRVLSLILTGAGVAGILALLVYAGRPKTLDWFISVLPFAAWLLAPYLLTGVAAWNVSNLFSGFMAFVSSLAAIAVGIGLPWKTLFIDRPDAQGALIFLVVPCWQWLIAGPPALLALRSARHKRCRSSAGADSISISRAD
jgi:hypothetical protein